MHFLGEGGIEVRKELGKELLSYDPIIMAKLVWPLLYATFFMCTNAPWYISFGI